MRKRKEGVPLRRKEREILDDLEGRLRACADRSIGFPANLDYEYSSLWRFFAYTLNNIGDPFGDGLWRIDTRAMEREVIRFFAELFRLGLDDCWGYVTHGGTEANMCGLYLAREAYPDGTVYHSEDAHYSVQKIVRLLRLRSRVIRSRRSGEMDRGDLYKALRSSRGGPAIVLANVGTTMKGATDDVRGIFSLLDELDIHEHHVHCDAALSGMLLPFSSGAPAFDFRLPIRSLAVSGHKFIGCPMPCGVLVARKQDVERIRRPVEYIGGMDATLSGSRNGHTPLFLWHAIRTLGKPGFRKLARRCLRRTRYALERLAAIGWPAWANAHSTTVVIRRPPDAIVQDWQLAVKGEEAHIILMPHVRKGKIDAFVADLAAAAP
jgi:histidine decarboxylase